MDDSFLHIRDDERLGAVDTIVAAFAADPVERSGSTPTSEVYARWFPPFAASSGGKAFDERTAWRLGDLSAVALWLPPGVEPDGDAIGGLLAESVDLEQARGHLRHPRADGRPVTRPIRTGTCAWLAVTPEHQGSGLGGHLLRCCLEVVDETQLPAYLETPNPRTVPFYERHGFQVVGVAQVGACPPLTLMLRVAG